MTSTASKVLLSDLAQVDRAAYERSAIARAELKAATVAAIDDGMTESEAARLSGVSRMTVRAWVGKQGPNPNRNRSHPNRT